MMASWMLYAVLISILISLAGIAAERAAAARGWSRRFVWVGTITLSVIWPLGAKLARVLPDRRPVSVLPFTIVVQSPISISADDAAAVRRAQLVDRSLIVVWVAMSALLLMRIANGVARVDRMRSTWRRGRVNGMRVRLTNNIGPAVVGLRPMDVVVPEWILSLDESLRALVIKHEDEHRLAGDPYLLFGSAIAVALMPWNAALWFQARRLRLALELDCDTRVLRAHPQPERYGMLILTIAQRRSAAPAVFSPMLSEPATNLERRIRAMRSTMTSRTVAYSGSLVAIALLAFASSLQAASPSLSGKAVMSAVSNALARAAQLQVSPTAPETTTRRRIPAVVPKYTVQRESVTLAPTLKKPQTPTVPTPHYPEMLRSAGVEGAVSARATIGADGRVNPNTILILKSTHELFGESVRTALASWRGAPNTVLVLSYVFVMNDQTGADLADLRSGLPANTVFIVGVAPERSAAPRIQAAPATQQAGMQQATYFDFQVERQAASMPGNPSPRYPDMLRSANVEGEVLAQFVVNPDGTPDMATFKVLKSTHDLFASSVRTSLPSMQFYPALVGGVPVRQLIQMPFQFSLAKSP